MAPYDIIGNICLVKFSRGTYVKGKKQWAVRFLKETRSVRTVREKSGKIKGRLRTPTTKWLAGEKTSEAVYSENGCAFRLNVDTCYFSPRLASERKEIAGMVTKGERVLVMFGGVGPFAIVIAKAKKASDVTTIELNRKAHAYALENVKRNKVSVHCVQGDVRKKVNGKYDRIVMARPNLEDSFLDVAFRAIAKKGIIHYYGFYPEEDLPQLRTLIEAEAKKAKRTIRIMKIKKAGEIGTKTFRMRVDIRVIR